MKKGGYDLTLGLGDWLTNKMGMPHELAIYVKLIVLLVALGIVCYLLWLFTRNVVIHSVHRAFLKTKTTWDDKLIDRGVFGKLAYLVPVILFEILLPVVFVDFQDVIPRLTRIANVVILIVFVWSLNSLLSAIGDILSSYKTLKDKPIASYIQVMRIVVFFIGGVLILSIMLGKSPLFFLGAMGAMGAVMLLIFKDTILGFVASIQISVYDIVREGDWISMPKFDADGDVIAINLNTVKVQNWDKTITTLPTYTLVSEPFKNWRGMSESGGRRIKRSIRIKVSSVRFCTAEQIDRFKHIQLIERYIEISQSEIAAYNQANGIDSRIRINGRHLTNLGIFRIYVESYLRSLPTINKEMTMMVRQLEPDEKGIPVEIYCFSSNKEWIAYESIIADIFDHLIASVPIFDLSIFEYPSDNGIKSITSEI